MPTLPEGSARISGDSAAEELSTLPSEITSENSEQSLPPVEKNLNSLVDKQFSTLKAESLAVNNYVTKLKTQISGCLAIGFGVTLALSGVWHATNVAYISHRMMSDSVSTEIDVLNSDFDAYNRAFTMVGDTAKTLYAVLSPLAAAASGFYFASKAEDENFSHQDDD